MRRRREHGGPPGATLYFTGWASLKIPRVPTGPVSESEVAGLDSYYEAVYDEQGRLARFTKFLRGERDWQDEYEYRDDGTLCARVMTRPDGSTLTEAYDRRGRIER